MTRSGADAIIRGMTYIDPSLARGVRRSYFRLLAENWRVFRQRRLRQQSRFGGDATVRTQKQLRRQVATSNKLLGPLLACSGTSILGRSRSAHTILTLFPESDAGEPVLTGELSRVVAMLLGWVCPGHGLLVRHPEVMFTSHAVERLIQRSGAIDLPISRAGLTRIHQCLCESLPLASVAAGALQWWSVESGKADAEELSVILPIARGAFLGRWSEEEQALVLRTFVATAHLTNAERIAAAEIGRQSGSPCQAFLAELLAPGWMSASSGPSFDAVISSLTHFDWRFEEEAREWRSTTASPRFGGRSAPAIPSGAELELALLAKRGGASDPQRPRL